MYFWKLYFELHTLSEPGLFMCDVFYTDCIRKKIPVKENKKMTFIFAKWKPHTVKTQLMKTSQLSPSEDILKKTTNVSKGPVFVKLPECL